MLRKHTNEEATAVDVVNKEPEMGPRPCPQPGCQQSGGQHPYEKGYVVYEVYGGYSGDYLTSQPCKCCDGKGFLFDNEPAYRNYCTGAGVRDVRTAYPNPISMSRKVFDSIKVREQSTPVEKKNEGCYIATAVYGDYDSPEVKVFRRFRDEKLTPTVLGHFFVRAYYLFSPIFLRFFGDNSVFKFLAKKILDCIYRNLESKS